jgi:aspartyl-tRNA synthetase
MEKLKRTVNCGTLNAKNVGEQAILNGWVHRIRDHGGIFFFNVRDRYGMTQVVVDPDADKKIRDQAAQLRLEHCIAVKGTVRARPKDMINTDMTTGEIEVVMEELLVLAESDVLPFMIDERSDAKEDLRFRYRYLDLRSFSMQRKLRLRHRVSFAAREYLDSQGFYEIETPTLIRSTPEGARDFLVPSRLQRGKFYALPQSPQLYKQLLMVSGFDRYFQLAHCFRDEDARGDRQPEHTQIDLEMSFVSQEDVFAVVEGAMAHVFRAAESREPALPFPRLSYREAMDRYGSDKPDLRFGLELRDFTSLAERGSFEIFRKIAADGGKVKILSAPGCASYSRRQIEELEELAKVYGAQGLAWMKSKGGKLEGGIARFYEGLEDDVLASLESAEDDLLLLVGSDWKTACTSLGAVRNRLGADLKLMDQNAFHFCWIVDFPLFEYNEEEKKWDPAHHMFTMPQEDSLPILEDRPGEAKGELYDLVCNGLELGSGSVRIHEPELQKRIFRIVGFSEEEAARRFGFLLDAFRFGAPPHGGIALGLDRLVMLMAGESTIREVIAFPKNTVGVSPMDDCPSEVEAGQLKDLGLKPDPEEKR